MAYALAIVADLMLGSRVSETLGAAGHEVELVPAIAQAQGLDRAEVIVADLDCEPPEALVGLGAPVLGFYQHTDVDDEGGGGRGRRRPRRPALAPRPRDARAGQPPAGNLKGSQAP